MATPVPTSDAATAAPPTEPDLGLYARQRSPEGRRESSLTQQLDWLRRRKERHEAIALGTVRGFLRKYPDRLFPLIDAAKKAANEATK
jgi:hypothetical protein